jgi:hypothetical protein
MHSMAYSHAVGSPALAAGRVGFTLELPRCQDGHSLASWYCALDFLRAAASYRVCYTTNGQPCSHCYVAAADGSCDKGVPECIMCGLTIVRLWAPRLRVGSSRHIASVSKTWLDSQSQRAAKARSYYRQPTCRLGEQITFPFPFAERLKDGSCFRDRPARIPLAFFTRFCCKRCT